MAIDWQHLPELSSDAPYDGVELLLAVWRDDPDCPYEVYLACWDSADHRWATTETEDDQITWLDQVEPVFWAEMNLPSDPVRQDFSGGSAK